MSELNGSICRHCGTDCGDLNGVRAHEPACAEAKKRGESMKKKDKDEDEED